ncbi:hypothetical protein ACOSQ4_021583 [Xanthoceras sorbifolium]
MNRYNEFDDIDALFSDGENENEDESVCLEKMGKKKKNISCVKPGGGKGRKTSEAWKHFRPYEEHGTERLRSRCNYCPQTYVCDTGGNGSTKLASEDPKQMCLVQLKQIQVSSFAIKDESGNRSSIGLSCFNKEETRKALAKMLIVDELPFRFVEKPGFQEFCRVGMPLFDIPSRRTIVRDIMQLYLDEKTSLIKLFRKSKVRRIFNFSQIADHRGDTIGKCIKKVLIDWGIDKVFIITVENASSNNTTILYIKRKLNSWKADGGAILNGKYLHLRCCAHIVNLIVNDELKEMNDSVISIRNAVKFVKSSSSRFDKFKKCVELEKIQDKGFVVLDVCTRWNSTYLMLVSTLKFIKAFERMEEEDGHYQTYFKETENGQNRIGPPHSEHWENAKVFVQFLKTLYNVTVLFSASLSVTSNLYFHKWSTINNQLMKMTGEGNSFVRHMVSSMKTKFKKILTVVLDPRFKLQYVYYCFKILYGIVSAESMTASIKDALVELYDCYHVLHGVTDWVDDIPSFSDVGDVEYTIGGKNEVERFLLEVERKCPSFDVLTWWNVSRKHYPILAFIAKDVFAMPIFTVASESAFSNGERVLDPFRGSLNSKTMECLICTENWLQAKRSNIAIEVAMALMQNNDTSLENLQFNEEAESGKSCKVVRSNVINQH